MAARVASVDWAPIWHSALIALVSALVYRSLARSLLGFARRLDERAEAPEARRSLTLITLAVSALRYALAFLVLVMVLREVGVDPTPLVAGASIAGVALAMGIQNLVKDLTAGVFILLEGQYAVGDYVEIGGQAGRVEEVGLRVTRLRDANGCTRYLPNGGIASVTNYSQGDLEFALTAPLANEQVEQQQSAVQSALAGFDREFGAFAAPPGALVIQTLPDDTRLLSVALRLRPARAALVQARLLPRVSAALDALGSPPPLGREPSLTRMAE